VGNTELDPQTIVSKAMEVASGICVFTNDRVVVDTLP
jgi:ATP-dependent protease HslVU (ClpYQ) peptidase subunit